MAEDVEGFMQLEFIQEKKRFWNYKPMYVHGKRYIIVNETGKLSSLGCLRNKRLDTWFSSLERIEVCDFQVFCYISDCLINFARKWRIVLIKGRDKGNLFFFWWLAIKSA